MRSFLLASMVWIAGLAACDAPNQDSDAPVEVVGDSRFQAWPAVGGRGTSFDLRVEANRSIFEFGATEVALGDGIQVESVTVQDGYNAIARVTIDPAAALGARDVSVVIEGRSQVAANAFEVVAESLRIDPSSAKMGETLQVALVGTETAWSQGYTWPNFGDDVRILDFQVLSATLAAAQIAVFPDARPGPRDVAMADGPKVVTLYDGFTVDRATITAEFDPKEAYQGKTVEFTIRGLNTDFAEGTTLEFWDDSGINADIQVTQLQVLDSENMYGRMRLSNAARIGYRDVLIRYEGEALLIPEAFQVLDSPPDLSDVYVGTGFDVTRSIDNASGELLEDVSAFAYFVIPLDPPCGSPPPPGMGPMPYDANGVFPVPPPPVPDDCPNPETVSAGDFVWFEGPENVVTLEKYIIASTGQIIYQGRDLTLEDYHFGTVYALHTQGDPDGIPEVTVPDVQPTVPGDYYILSPNFSNNFTWNRAEDLTYSWTPALTYPDAVFSTQISGTLVATGEGGFAGSIPWDDGSHTYTAAELSALQASQVSFGAASYIEGREFGLPFSTIQYCKSDSTLSTSATLFLE
jgi:hypothetical protein